MHAYRGEIDKAFHWLQVDMDLNGGLPGYYSFDPEFERLHGDPRWQVLTRRAGIDVDPLDEIDFGITLPEE